MDGWMDGWVYFAFSFDSVEMYHAILIILALFYPHLQCVMPLVLRVVSGYDGAILAYGPQGSGKSYTLFASDQTAHQFGERDREDQAVGTAFDRLIIDRLC